MSQEVTIKVICISCGQSENITVPAKAYEDWKDGAGNIQDLMPKVHPMYREALIQNMCLDCLSRIFNSPKPGESWGEPIGECNCCGSTIYAKDGDICPACKHLWDADDYDEEEE